MLRGWLSAEDDVYVAGCIEEIIRPSCKGADLGIGCGLAVVAQSSMWANLSTSPKVK